MILDDIQKDIDFFCDKAEVNKTQFIRGKYLYKVERVLRIN